MPRQSRRCGRFALQARQANIVRAPLAFGERKLNVMAACLDQRRYAIKCYGPPPIT